MELLALHVLIGIDRTCFAALLGFSFDKRLTTYRKVKNVLGQLALHPSSGFYRLKSVRTGLR